MEVVERKELVPSPVKNKENRWCKCWCRSAKNQSVQDRKSIPLDGDQTIESKFDVDRTNGFR